MKSTLPGPSTSQNPGSPIISADKSNTSKQNTSSGAVISGSNPSISIVIELLVPQPKYVKVYVPYPSTLTVGDKDIILSKFALYGPSTSQ